MRVISGVVGFEWDDGNRDKNLKKHGITNAQCEEVFEDEKRVISSDIRHSEMERRYLVIGKTRNGKLLRIAFTLREDRIRVISARPTNRKEKPLYE